VDWRKKRKDDIDQQMLHIVTLLNEYEQKLTYEDDPAQIVKFKNQISKLNSQKLELKEELNSLNQEHEQLRKSLIMTMPEVNFEDMDFVITALLKQQVSSIDMPDTFQKTNPLEKMSKNSLTHHVKFMLEVGLAKGREVGHLIENIVKTNFPSVPENLIATLNTEYRRLMEQGVKGDDLFMSLYEFSTCLNRDPRRQAAGLAVLCYFFETCDVFEP
jgi:hypothetical protein